MGDYSQFIRNVKKKTGIDLAQYKEAQMRRRLTSLRDKRGFYTFHDYFQKMMLDEQMFNEFLERMTINVSEFYRNPKRWEVLEKKILPQLMKKTKQLKVWSAACSTGEEPYTLVMILSKFMPLSEVSVFATDIDKTILEQAKNGFYAERSLKEVPEEMLKTYFEKETLGYRIKEEVRKRVIFKQQNLLSDRFESNYDLIVCRNVMIYFTEEAKNELYMKFSNALKPGGVLFVGSTEQIFNPRKYGFESKETFFYQKAMLQHS